MLGRAPRATPRLEPPVPAKSRNTSSKIRFISRCKLKTGLKGSDRDAALLSRSPRAQGTSSRTFMVGTSFKYFGNHGSDEPYVGWRGRSSRGDRRLAFIHKY